MKVEKSVQLNKKGPSVKVSGQINKKNKAISQKPKNPNNAKPIKAQQKEKLKVNQNKNSESKVKKQKAAKEEILAISNVSNGEQTADIDEKKAKKLAKKFKKKELKKANKQLKLNEKTKITTNPNGEEHQKRDPALDASTVFVGNLPVTTKRVQIVKLFAKYGNVQSIRLRTAAGQVIFKHKQRKQAGSLNAYVVLNSPEAAQKALELNGHEFKDSHLRVTPSDKEQNQKDHDPKRTVFVGNLKYTANEEKLREIFSNCGEINYIRCLYDGKNKCRGTGYVCFKSPEAVGLAMELNETMLDERPIHVERYSTKKLGAKEARDKANANQKSGAKKRIDLKKKGAKGSSSEVKDKKKSEFRGVKVCGIKKKNKKKVTNEMKTIANKIAPKIKAQKA